jgi:integrase
MASRPADNRPTRPWLPAKVGVHGVYQRTVVPKRGPKKGRTVKVYDVRFTVDGHSFSRTLERKGWADAYADRLRLGAASGQLFDPATREFVEPAAAVQPPTFAEYTAEHFARQWPGWSPSRRNDCQRELARACLLLVRDDAPALTVKQRKAADRYLRHVLLVSPTADTETDVDADAVGEWPAWFDRWSLQLPEVTPEHLYRYLEVVRIETLDGRKRVLAPRTLLRCRIVVKAVFNSAARSRVIEWNPWDGVEWSAPPTEDVVDPDLVMSQRQVHQLAARCGRLQPRTAAFVLIQGVCGLRPGEVRELRRRDVQLGCRPPLLTVRGSRSDAPARFFDPGQSRSRPLKGRDRKARRRIPIPRHLVPALHDHLDRHVARKPDALVCTTPNGGRLNLSNFHRDVWEPARRDVFPEGSTLRRVRRHDLRHSAITAWLNAGVMLKTAQQWSGHRQMSVLLDTYLGVMHGDAEVSLQRVEHALDDALGNDADGHPDPSDSAAGASGGASSSQDGRNDHGRREQQGADDDNQ